MHADEKESVHVSGSSEGLVYADVEYFVHESGSSEGLMYTDVRKGQCTCVFGVSAGLMYAFVRDCVHMCQGALRASCMLILGTV